MKYFSTLLSKLETKKFDVKTLEINFIIPEIKKPVFCVKPITGVGKLSKYGCKKNSEQNFIKIVTGQMPSKIVTGQMPSC